MSHTWQLSPFHLTWPFPKLLQPAESLQTASQCSPGIQLRIFGLWIRARIPINISGMTINILINAAIINWIAPFFKLGNRDITINSSKPKNHAKVKLWPRINHKYGISGSWKNYQKSVLSLFMNHKSVRSKLWSPKWSV